MDEPLDTSWLPKFTADKSLVSWEYLLDNIIEGYADYEVAIAFTNLYWPNFVERRGCIVRAEFATDALDRCWDSTGGNREQIELVLNHLHIADIIPSESGAADERLLSYLGQSIAQMWRARLRDLFPDRECVVTFVDDESDGTPSSPTIYCSQVQNQSD